MDDRIFRDPSRLPKDHTYEELRNAALRILGGEAVVSRKAPKQLDELARGVAEVFQGGPKPMSQPELSPNDQETLREVFYDLFLQRVITPGSDGSNPAFPCFRLSSFGKKVLQTQDLYFFHDVSSYETRITSEIPDINPTTLIYLEEAMQAFLSGCYLSATVMVGVATEHSLLVLFETIENNPAHAAKYTKVSKERWIHNKFAEFRKRLRQHDLGSLPRPTADDLDLRLDGVVSMIRNFRNQSGHPTGQIVGREQCYVLLQVFIPCCKKVYELIHYFK